MASRLQNIMGYGESQVTPSSNIDGGQIVQLYQQNKANQENQRRYDDRQKDQNEKDQYGIIGDALNPKNFNQAIHGRILQAQKELAQKIKSGNPSYGDTFLLAQNKAAELGQVSQQLNAVDQQLALTKKEYEFDKRINSGAIEMAARKRILEELNRNGTIDGSINYFDEALNDNPDIALIDKSGYTFTDLRPEEKQPLEYDIKKRNAAGRTSQYKWKMDNVPAYYDVQQGGEYDPPKVVTRAEASGFKDASNKDVPMLSEEAYRRFSLTPSNVVALNQRIKSQYPNINLRSAIADKLRRVEAYKDIDRNKPSPKESIVEQQPIPSTYNTTNVNTGGGSSNVNDIYKRIQEATSKRAKDYASGNFNSNAVVLSEMPFDEQGVIIDFANKGRSGNDSYTPADIKVIEDSDGKIGVYELGSGTRIGYLPRIGTNLKVQPGVKEKREVVQQGKASKPATTPKEDLRKKYNY